MRVRRKPTKDWWATCRCGTKLTAEQWFVVCLTGCPVCEDMRKEVSDDAGA